MLDLWRRLLGHPDAWSAVQAFQTLYLGWGIALLCLTVSLFFVGHAQDQDWANREATLKQVHNRDMEAARTALEGRISTIMAQLSQAELRLTELRQRVAQVRSVESMISALAAPDAVRHSALVKHLNALANEQDAGVRELQASWISELDLESTQRHLLMGMHAALEGRLRDTELLRVTCPR